MLNGSLKLSLRYIVPHHRKLFQVKPSSNLLFHGKVHSQPRNFSSFKKVLNQDGKPNPTSCKPKEEGKLAIQFTCKVCSNRQTNFLSKVAYTQGVVLIQCLNCDNRHLIADNLGWFQDKKVNIETILKERGEEVNKWNSAQLEGLIEVIDKKN